MNLVILPVTEPGDETYGTVPERIEEGLRALFEQTDSADSLNASG